MARRLDKTLADYIGIAISPVLIMAMVGSLVAFLLEVFYQGNYETRLQVILALFVMAIVLIGRISIEMGTEQAALYAGPLAIVTAVALFMLVDHGWIFNVSLLGLVWWSTHKLTWDCTLIDETEDASGEGLLQSTGLEPDKKAATQPPAETAEAAKETTNGSPESAQEEPKKEPKKPKPDKRKPHAPGVWIVYFSLAALPLFGLGELFLRNHPEQKHHAFFLLLIYVASGLGLLLTTSFLGLRRYLRQRQLQMPVTMAGAWIGFGSILLLFLLAIAALLPRPGMEQSPFQSPFALHSPDRKASRWAIGNDGAQGPGKAGSQEASGQQSGGQKPGDQPSDNQQSDGQQSKKQESGGKQSGGQQSGGKQSGDQQSGDQSSEGQQQGESSQSQSSQSQSGQSSQTKQSRDSNGQSSSGDQPQKDSNSQSNQADSNGSQDAKTESSPDSSSNSSSQPPSTPWSLPELSFALGSEWLMALARWALYIVLGIILVVWLWRSRHELIGFLRGILQALRDLWASLFGGGKREKEEAAVEEAPRALPKPFAAFSDPFGTGMAAQWSPEELVRYTFEALEAWARERGCTRPDDQTAYEFVRCVAARAPALAAGARQLAELYNQAAYAPGTLNTAQVTALRQLWQLMSTAGTAPPVA